MANKQISDLQARTFDGDSIIAHDVENTDPSTMSQKPYLTGSATGHAVANFVANGEEFTTDLDTTDKHITGAINELADEISAKVSKNGDDISGTLTYKTDINPSTTPSANKSFNIVALDDVNDEQLLRLETYQTTTNTIRGQMVVSRKVGNNTILNYFNMGIKADGTKDITVSEPALWQEAIGIKVLSATDNITVTAGTNRFSHNFTIPSGYSYIGYSASWGDSAIASTSFDFSSMMFGTNQIFVNIIAPSAETGRQSTLTYKLILLKN